MEIASPIPPERILEAFIDHKKKIVGVVSNDFLIQTLRRDCPEIARNLDEDFASELQESRRPVLLAWSDKVDPSVPKY